jgi:hypothetical protein
MAAVRYIFRYIFKGEDRAVMKLHRQEIAARGVLNETDETDLYLTGRYLSVTEAFWKLYSFSILEMSPTVFLLPVHLSDENVDDDARMSKLEAFFVLNRERRAQGDEYLLLYSNVSNYYVWRNDICRWKPRERASPQSEEILT